MLFLNRQLAEMKTYFVFFFFFCLSEQMFREKEFSF